MHTLATNYMGLALKNPIIVGASGLTGSVEKIRECEAAGAGAVVIKSIFEEQIQRQLREESTYAHPEAADYILAYGRENAIEEYLALIRGAKAAVSIPVIASVHCSSSGSWTEFAARLEEAGADALELNVFLPPTDYLRDSASFETAYLAIARAVKEQARIPVAMKIGPYFTSLGTMIDQLGARLDGLVLFNRFAGVDFDIDTLEPVPAERYSQPGEVLLPLRWVSIMSARADCDLVGSSGVHDAGALIRLLLAGAPAVQVCSTLYNNGVGHIGTMLQGLTEWMEAHRFVSLDQFVGRLSQKSSQNPAAYDRVQFMKTSVDA